MSFNNTANLVTLNGRKNGQNTLNGHAEGTEKEERKSGARGWKRIMSHRTQLILDVTVLAGAFLLANLLRFDFAIPEREWLHIFVQLSYVVLIQMLCLALSGVHMFIWRYIGIGEVRAFLKAAAMSALPVFLLRVGLSAEYQAWRVPFTVIVIDTILAFGGVLGMRVLRRIVYEELEKKDVPRSVVANKTPVLLIGAGRAGVMTAKEIQNCGDVGLEIKGFVDDAPQKQGAIINGIGVLGTIDDLSSLVHDLGIDHVVVSIAKASRREFRRILDICEAIPVKVRVIPGLFDILQGKVKVSRIRSVQIEDLLGREPVQLDEECLTSFLTDKNVMVTGAGGSIGAELARQVARFKPRNLLLVERAEPALFTIDRELTNAFPDLSIRALIADVGDESRMRTIFSLHPTSVIFHAAAHKHVPMMEFNPGEAVKNNILATQCIGSLAGEFGVEAFVLISTDKAVNPTSVMGATKRVAELAIQNLDKIFPTRYVAVRFGNVIGSAGSVIPIFSDQIQKGGPVTVTHPDVVRYFMTIPEASQLVLQAGAMGNGGEICVLDMGHPVRILDLAKDVIALSGFKPFEDIDIIFTGLRPGEKLYEELQLVGESHAIGTSHPKIFVGKIAAYPHGRVEHALDMLEQLANNGSERGLREFLRQLLPESRLGLSPGSNGHRASVDEIRDLPERAVATM